jgi:hypothetical protein
MRDLFDGEIHSLCSTSSATPFIILTKTIAACPGPEELYELSTNDNISKNKPYFLFLAILQYLPRWGSKSRDLEALDLSIKFDSSTVHAKFSAHPPLELTLKTPQST